MARIYYDQDVSLDLLRDKVIAIIGYGNQGEAQAKNLRDSKLNVILGLRKGGKSWEKAKKDGFEVYSIAEASDRADVIHILIPDPVQPKVYSKDIAPKLHEGKTLSFAHGFNIHFRQITPPNNIDVIMIAPKGPGAKVRESYISGTGVPALIAVYQDYSGNAKNIALAIAKGLGCTRVGVIETTFKEETETDLIGEQTVLVGGLMELIKTGYEVLVEAGYQPEVAFFEACNEAKLIMDLIYQRGISGMLKAVSDTAKYGGLTVGPKIIDEHVKENMRRALREVQSGKFAREWIEEDKKGRPLMNRLLKEIENHPLEVIGRKMRKMAGIE